MAYSPRASINEIISPAEEQAPSLIPLRGWLPVRLYNTHMYVHTHVYTAVPGNT